MAALPARIRQHIRDHVTSSDSPLAKKTADLTAILGCPISLDPEWAMLWKNLQIYYPDPSTFVPGIAQVIIMWCDAMIAWLESDDNEDQVDKMLDGLKARGKLDIAIEISRASKVPTTAWFPNKLVFVIALPKGELPRGQTVLAGFSSDLLKLFTDSPPMGATPGATLESAEDPEDWADLDLGSPESHPIMTPSSKQASGPPGLSIQVGEDPIPEISTIPRPEELIRKPPYWMVVRQENRMRVVVQGSHGPSLILLDAYLKRWCRGEVARSDRPPVAEIKLQESAFGLGLLHDTLTLDAIRGREVTAMLVLVFIEGVLGYTPLSSSNVSGSVWEFRRTKGFK